jgi:hypothetical protein
LNSGSFWVGFSYALVSITMVIVGWSLVFAGQGKPNGPQNKRLRLGFIFFIGKFFILAIVVKFFGDQLKNDPISFSVGMVASLCLIVSTIIVADRFLAKRK